MALPSPEPSAVPSTVPSLPQPSWTGQLPLQVGYPPVPLGDPVAGILQVGDQSRYGRAGRLVRACRKPLQRACHVPYPDQLRPQQGLLGRATAARLGSGPAGAVAAGAPDGSRVRHGRAPGTVIPADRKEKNALPLSLNLPVANGCRCACPIICRDLVGHAHPDP